MEVTLQIYLRNINDMEHANIFLKEYIHSFNAQFAVKPKEAFSAYVYVPVPETCNLDRLLCVKYQRKLSKGSTISLSGKTFFT